MSDYLTFVAYDEQHGVQLKSSDNGGTYASTTESPPGEQL